MFGGGTIVFNASTIHEKRSSGGTMTAASTDSAKTYGFLFYRSTITGSGSNNTNLGRPWRQGPRCLPRVDPQQRHQDQPAVDQHGRLHLAERPLLRIPEHRPRRDRQRQPSPAQRRAGRQLHPAEVPGRQRRLEPDVTVPVRRRVRPAPDPAPIRGLSGPDGTVWPPRIPGWPHRPGRRRHRSRPHRRGRPDLAELDKEERHGG
ncbi:hypothetical protein V2I01_31610 [Micromonospora sp. BRA006-A]|nr:hypothetical protein [Micromonospora sp. BRA006-A]